VSAGPLFPGRRVSEQAGGAWRDLLNDTDVQGRAFESYLWEAASPGSPLLLCGAVGFGKTTLLHLLARRLAAQGPVLLVRDEGALKLGLSRLPDLDTLLGEYVQVWGGETGPAAAGLSVLDLGSGDLRIDRRLLPATRSMALLEWANARGYAWVLMDQASSCPQLLSVPGAARLVLCVYTEMSSSVREVLDTPFAPEVLLSQDHAEYFEWWSLYGHLSVLWLRLERRGPGEGLLLREPCREAEEVRLEALLAGPSVQA